MARSPRVDSRFRRLFDEHHGAIRDYCHRRLPATDANDATAEVFLVAWRKLDSVQSGDAALRWLYGAARNVGRSIQRKHRRSERLLIRLAAIGSTQAVEPLDGQLLRHVDEENLMRALDRLNADDRELLRLHAWEDLDLEQLALVFDIKPHEAAMRLPRALVRLRRAYQATDLLPHLLTRLRTYNPVPPNAGPQDHAPAGTDHRKEPR